MTAQVTRSGIGPDFLRLELVIARDGFTASRIPGRPEYGWPLPARPPRSLVVPMCGSILPAAVGCLECGRDFLPTQQRNRYCLQFIASPAERLTRALHLGRVQPGRAEIVARRAGWGSEQSRAAGPTIAVSARLARGGYTAAA